MPVSAAVSKLGADACVSVTVVEARHVHPAAQEKGRLVLSVNQQEGTTEGFEGRETYWGSQYDFLINTGVPNGALLTVELAGCSMTAHASVRFAAGKWRWAAPRWFDIKSAAGERVGSVALECAGRPVNPVEVGKFRQAVNAAGGKAITVGEEVSWRKQQLKADLCTGQVDSVGDGHGFGLEQETTSPVYTARTHFSAEHQGDEEAGGGGRSSRTLGTPKRQERDSGGEGPGDKVFVEKLAGILQLSGERQLKEAMRQLLREHGGPVACSPEETPKRQTSPKPSPKPSPRRQPSSPLQPPSRQYHVASDSPLRPPRMAPNAHETSNGGRQGTPTATRRVPTPLTSAVPQSCSRRVSAVVSDAPRTPPRRGRSPGELGPTPGRGLRRSAPRGVGRNGTSRSPRPAAHRGSHGQHPRHSPLKGGGNGGVYSLPRRLAHLNPNWDPGDTGGSSFSVQTAPPVGHFSQHPPSHQHSSHPNTLRRASSRATSPYKRTSSPHTTETRRVPAVVQRLGPGFEPGWSVTSTQSLPLPLNDAPKARDRSRPPVSPSGRRTSSPCGRRQSPPHDRSRPQPSSAYQRHGEPRRSPVLRPQHFAHESHANTQQDDGGGRPPPRSPLSRPKQDLGCWAPPQRLPAGHNGDGGARRDGVVRGRVTDTHRHRDPSPCGPGPRPVTRGGGVGRVGLKADPPQQLRTKQAQKKPQVEERQQLLQLLNDGMLTGESLLPFLPDGAEAAVATGDDLLDFEAMERLCSL
eukprot:Hpha_TRINITY_DN15624_c4_g9::TRINITY_DN15624_c4_g9_i1::g.99265::m.99265